MTTMTRIISNTIVIVVIIIIIIHYSAGGSLKYQRVKKKPNKCYKHWKQNNHFDGPTTVRTRRPENANENNDDARRRIL